MPSTSCCSHFISFSCSLTVSLSCTLLSFIFFFNYPNNLCFYIFYQSSRGFNFLRSSLNLASVSFLFSWLLTIFYFFVFHSCMIPKQVVKGQNYTISVKLFRKSLVLLYFTQVTIYWVASSLCLWRTTTSNSPSQHFLPPSRHIDSFHLAANITTNDLTLDLFKEQALILSKACLSGLTRIFLQIASTIVSSGNRLQKVVIVISVVWL